jgi:hypothetical protein
MSESQVDGGEFSHAQLVRLHGLTQQVEKIFAAQLRSYLDALAPLFRPRRLFGNHMEGAGKEMVMNADQNLNDLREVYFKGLARPFDLRKELPVPLESIPTQIQLHEWEYSYEAQAATGPTKITITAPLTWVLGYPTAYSYSMMRQVANGKQEHDRESVRSFILRASIMHLMFSHLPELPRLFEGLRYKVDIRKSALLGELPLVTVSAPVATVRPTDDLLLFAASYSGRSGFVEVIDPQQAAHIPDPLQDQISKILEAANEPSTFN